jgi:hypothetical protein
MEAGMSYRCLLLATALIVGSLPASAQSPPSTCGDKVTVMRADTLSSIAGRCNVDEAQIMRANPGIRRSTDLVVGAELSLSTGAPPASSGVDRLGSAAREAGEALADIARGFGASIEDLLQKNPDLSQRLRRLGEQFDIPALDLNRAQVTAAPEAGPTGTVVTVSAIGLPKEVPVRIGLGGLQSAYEVVDRARTEADGSLRVTIPVPDWAGDKDRIVFVVAGENDDWKVRTAPFRVTGTTL